MIQQSCTNLMTICEIVAGLLNEERFVKSYLSVQYCMYWIWVRVSISLTTLKQSRSKIANILKQSCNNLATQYILHMYCIWVSTAIITLTRLRNNNLVTKLQSFWNTPATILQLRHSTCENRNKHFISIVFEWLLTILQQSLQLRHSTCENKSKYYICIVFERVLTIL